MSIWADRRRRNKRAKKHRGSFLSKGVGPKGLTSEGERDLGGTFSSPSWGVEERRLGKHMSEVEDVETVPRLLESPLKPRRRWRVGESADDVGTVEASA